MGEESLVFDKYINMGYEQILKVLSIPATFKGCDQLCLPIYYVPVRLPDIHLFKVQVHRALSQQKLVVK